MARWARCRIARQMPQGGPCCEVRSRRMFTPGRTDTRRGVDKGAGCELRLEVAGRGELSIEVPIVMDADTFRQLAELYSRNCPLSDFRVYDVDRGEYVHRAEWWKRGEAPAEYVAEYEPPEWWQEGDEPPDFGCAA